MIENQNITDTVLRRYLGLDEYNPNQPRDENGRWTSGNKSVVKISKEEYAYVTHELNNNLTQKEFQKGKTIRYIGNYGYDIKINEFNDYSILNRWSIDDD